MSGEFDAATLEAMFAASSPPQTPREVIDAVKGIEGRLSRLDRLQALAVLSGLQTEAAFAAHSVRLDMAMRLILACANGDASPTRDKIFRLINRDLVDCGMNHLEDPPEDFFLSIAATRRGPFRLFQGVWEKATAFTEDVIDAFGRLPPSPWGAQSLDSAYALLTLSDVLASRAGLSGRTLGEGDATQNLVLPTNRRLSQLGGRCLVSWADLHRLGVKQRDLAPFLMENGGVADVSTVLPGESDIERRPLMGFVEGILVVAPHNLSTAVRSHLIESASASGAEEYFRYLLLNAQSERISIASFAPLAHVPVMNIDGHPVRQTIWHRAPGRPIHFLQIVDRIGLGPVHFGADTDTDAATLDNIVSRSIETARESMRKHGDFREGIGSTIIGAR